MTRLLTLLLMVTLALSSSGQTGKEIIIDIIDMSDSFEQSDDLSTHIVKDVEILRGPGFGEMNQNYSLFSTTTLMEI